MTVAEALRQEPAEHRGGRGGGGVDPGQASCAIGSERGPGVESEPAEPQQRGTQHDQGQVMRTVGGASELEALADEQDQDKCGDTGVDVDDRATGEVDRCDRGGQAALSVINRAEDLRRDAVLRVGQ